MKIITWSFVKEKERIDSTQVPLSTPLPLVGDHIRISVNENYKILKRTYVFRLTNRSSEVERIIFEVASC